MHAATTGLAVASLAAVALAQSSSMSMSSMASMATASSTAAGNMTATNATSEYAAGLVAALQSANLTTLATVLGGFPALASQLEQANMAGQNLTVFAPNNGALAPLLADPSSINQTELASTLTYHISPMTLPVSALGNGMNHTIAPSLLQEPLLGENQYAPLVLSIGVDGQPRVRTASQNVTVLGNTTYQNLLVHVVNEVINPPMNLTATLADANLTTLVGALSGVSADVPAMLSNTPRLTIFAPSNSAFNNISQLLTQLDNSTILTVLTNHIINGTVVYSDEIMANTTAVSASGETFTFSMMNGTVMVMSGNSSARIIRSDIPITNGVVHIIDSVLANTMSNPEAAAAAATSYASEAAAAATAMPSGVAPAGSNSNTGAGVKTVVAGASLVAALFAGLAVLA